MAERGAEFDEIFAEFESQQAELRDNLVAMDADPNITVGMENFDKDRYEKILLSSSCLIGHGHISRSQQQDFGFLLALVHILDGISWNETNKVIQRCIQKDNNASNRIIDMMLRKGPPTAASILQLPSALAQATTPKGEPERKRPRKTYTQANTTGDVAISYILSALVLEKLGPLNSVADLESFERELRRLTFYCRIFSNTAIAAGRVLFFTDLVARKEGHKFLSSAVFLRDYLVPQLDETRSEISQATGLSADVVSALLTEVLCLGQADLPGFLTVELSRKIMPSIFLLNRYIKGLESSWSPENIESHDTDTLVSPGKRKRESQAPTHQLSSNLQDKSTNPIYPLAVYLRVLLSDGRVESAFSLVSDVFKSSVLPDSLTEPLLELIFQYRMAAGTIFDDDNTNIRQSLATQFLPRAPENSFLMNTVVSLYDKLPDHFQGEQFTAEEKKHILLGSRKTLVCLLVWRYTTGRALDIIEEKYNYFGTDAMSHDQKKEWVRSFVGCPNPVPRSIMGEDGSPPDYLELLKRNEPSIALLPSAYSTEVQVPEDTVEFLADSSEEVEEADTGEEISAGALRRGDETADEQSLASLMEGVHADALEPMSPVVEGDTETEEEHHLAEASTFESKAVAGYYTESGYLPDYSEDDAQYTKDHTSPGIPTARIAQPQESVGALESALDTHSEEDEKHEALDAKNDIVEPVVKAADRVDHDYDAESSQPEDKPRRRHASEVRRKVTDQLDKGYVPEGANTEEEEEDYATEEHEHTSPQLSGAKDTAILPPNAEAPPLTLTSRVEHDEGYDAENSQDETSLPAPKLPVYDGEDDEENLDASELAMEVDEVGGEAVIEENTHTTANQLQEASRQRDTHAAAMQARDDEDSSDMDSTSQFVSYVPPRSNTKPLSSLSGYASQTQENHDLERDPTHPYSSADASVSDEKSNESEGDAVDTKLGSSSKVTDMPTRSGMARPSSSMAVAPEVDEVDALSLESKDSVGKELVVNKTPTRPRKLAIEDDSSTEDRLEDHPANFLGEPGHEIVLGNTVAEANTGKEDEDSSEDGNEKDEVVTSVSRRSTRSSRRPPGSPLAVSPRRIKKPSPARRSSARKSLRSASKTPSESDANEEKGPIKLEGADTAEEDDMSDPEKSETPVQSRVTRRSTRSSSSKTRTPRTAPAAEDEEDVSASEKSDRAESTVTPRHSRTTRRSTRSSGKKALVPPTVPEGAEEEEEEDASDSEKPDLAGSTLTPRHSRTTRRSTRSSGNKTLVPPTMPEEDGDDASDSEHPERSESTATPAHSRATRRNTRSSGSKTRGSRSTTKDVGPDNSTPASASAKSTTSGYSMDMKYKELFDACKEHGLSTRGKKDVLLGRLIAMEPIDENKEVEDGGSVDGSSGSDSSDDSTKESVTHNEEEAKKDFLLKTYTAKQLKDALGLLGLDKTGKKADLADRLAREGPDVDTIKSTIDPETPTPSKTGRRKAFRQASSASSRRSGGTESVVTTRSSRRNR